VEGAAAVLRAGEIVALPTETVYGLAANAFEAQAVGRISSQRPSGAQSHPSSCGQPRDGSALRGGVATVASGSPMLLAGASDARLAAVQGDSTGGDC